MPFYICPRCKNRRIDHDGREGFSQEPPSCHHCGFGFMFELLNDYYPAQATGFVVCDQDARILAAGRGVFELAGYREQELIGANVVDRLGLSGFEGEQNPAQIALEWGVRRLDEKLELRTRAGQQKAVTADFFPAYDEDGGLLVALTPRR
jgi:PAS domain-containing protein